MAVTPWQSFVNIINKNIKPLGEKPKKGRASYEALPLLIETLFKILAPIPSS